MLSLHFFYFIFSFSIFPLKLDDKQRPKFEGRTTPTCKELRQNFSMIHCRVLERGEFYHIYNQRLGE